MNQTAKRFGLAALLLAIFVGCVQPPAPGTGEFEVSDENGNTVTTQAIPTNGLKGEYYDNMDFTGTLKTRYDATVNRNPGTNAPITGIQPTTYSVRWTGQIMPAFNETYTFTLTYADGARLMVNGQVLVNDWVDGARRTRTGTVALQANTKYDIRLEWYRNATNAGAIKLEWQSPSRIKQVVPQANLFPLEAQVKNALQELESDSSFQTSGIQLDRAMAIARNYNGNEILFVPEQSQLGIVYGIFVQSNLVKSLRLRIENQQLLLTDLSTKSTVSLGDPNRFKNEPSASDKQQVISLLTPFLTRSQYSSEIINPLVNSTNGNFRTQVVVGWVLDIPGLIQAPASCSNCQDTANDYKSAVAYSVGSTIEFAAAGAGVLLRAGTLAKKVFDYALGFSVSADALIGLNLGYFNLAPSWQAYLDCIAGKRKVGDTPILGCPPGAFITPLSITKSFPVGTQGQEEITIKNIGSPSDPQSQWPKSVLQVQWTARDLPGFKAPFDPLFASRLLLKPGDSYTFKVGYNCQTASTVISGGVTLTHNGASSPNSVNIPVNITCTGAPKISVSPSSISLEAGTYAAADGTFTIINSGSTELKLKGIGPDTTWILVDRNSASDALRSPIPPGQSRNVKSYFNCGELIETRTGNISVFHEDVTSPNPSIVSVSINCKKPLVSLKFDTTYFEQWKVCPSGSSCFGDYKLDGDKEAWFTIKNETNQVAYWSIAGTGHIINYAGLGYIFTPRTSGGVLQPMESQRYRIDLEAGYPCGNIVWFATYGTSYFSIASRHNFSGPPEDTQKVPLTYRCSSGPKTP